MVTIKQRKKQIREEVLQKLKIMDDEDFAQKNKQIYEHILTCDLWQKSKIIGITLSRGREIGTRPIIEKAWQLGKKIAVPKCFPEHKEMRFYFLDHYEQLELSYFDLYEPKLSEVTEVHKDDIDTMFVPGVAYSQSGYRIGFGGGYYDRYLKQYHGETISLLFDEQKIDQVPIEEHDIPVNWLITPDQIMKTTKLDN
ncbi:5-formyltetrahydrofolate cyclo-ligase [Terrilactibacillus sp. BCM23-1]|uniref:5-formyltetrahydrofolate cyclo-ligase n=1 Tax=Terrilactibacillus tamarindi TaxID=2599694 RepID=A0A6N8CSK6_9BACI|nr:5-formyltetrahydrofolate cyclo-ligase [Terrilactibacillus tamarindi]MTT33179.1 5-formyltetrahydrofolate cyclo-ligase [Terrilactibacillus tamarindi]